MDLMRMTKMELDLGRIRTCNLLIRSQTRYPLRHEADLGVKLESTHIITNNV